MDFGPIRARAGTYLCYKTTKRHIKDNLLLDTIYVYNTVWILWEF